MITELCLGTRAIPLAPQAMMATEAMARSGTCFFDHGDRGEGPSARASLLLRSQQHRASSQAQFRYHSTVPLLGLGEFSLSALG
ncbi:MAG TPA: hypothetical protein VL485_11305 [Ktedonobacteraceae bacterium]|nr:hypothetical protein [Ktedonobacteraceae bacterium]